MKIPAWLQSLLPVAGSGSCAPPSSAPSSESLAPENVVQRAAHDSFAAGLVAYSAHDYATAITCFERALSDRHDDADAHNNLGLSYLGDGRGEDAMDAFVLAIHFRPRFPQAFYNMGLAALQRGEFQEVVTSLARALELQPDFAAAHNTLGYVLSHQIGEFERGAAHIRHALKLSPADPDVRCNYGAVLTQEGRAEEAIVVCSELLTAYPDMHEARLNRSLACLKLGRFAEAWPDYEARKHARGNYVPRALPFPEWQGQPLPDKRLLVYAEQGLGDQIMFASCVPDVLTRAQSCMIECAPQLVPLFSRSFPGAAIESQMQGDARLTRVAKAAAIDFQVAIGSLPAQLRKHLSDFVRPAGFLLAAPARIAYWKSRLDALGPGLKIGISWSGGAASTRGASRSTHLAQWLPILRQSSCHFVNLQYGNVGDELRAVLGEHQLVIHDWRDAIENYDETAALVTALDLVISVQTALVHLAGALGKPVWVLLQAACEWRYGEQGESMPWYPSARLMRQRRADDWQPVTMQIAQDLAQLAQR
jgi:Flp pilus assembly protein TadD